MTQSKNILTALVLSISIALLSFSACNDEDVTTNPENDIENLPNVSGYPIVGTNQSTFFNNTSHISEVFEGQDFYGQNANYPGNSPQYVDNGDGTVSDMVTGLMWQNTFDHNNDGSINYADKLTYDEILALVEDGVSYAGYDDWRLPTIKEQYSLILFSGRDISGYEGSSTDGLIPFIDTEAFEFAYGDVDAGERLIDMQCATTNVYVSQDIEKLVFGVNFADGRIKGYGMQMMGQGKAFNYLLVRGRTDYGINDFIDNNDGTITDNNTDLMWMQDDSEEGMLWEDALAFAEGNEFAGHTDWRLPDAKELQSILDYTQSPSTSNSAAIDPLFNCTSITNEAGLIDYPYYWSSTTHGNWTTGNDGAWGVYLSFGRAMGNMQPPFDSTGEANWIDVHGAGAQRSDPKTGDQSEYSDGHGPQGDAIRILNYVRLVRNIN